LTAVALLRGAEQSKDPHYVKIPMIMI